MAAGMAIAAGVQMVGSLMQGQATSDALSTQANLNMRNALEAKKQGNFNAQKSQLMAGSRIGQMAANYGASGVTSTSGSVLDILGASAANAELDRLNILHGADIRAAQYENEASMQRTGARSSLLGSYFGAAGSAASGAGRIYSSGMGANNSGDENA